MNLKLKEIVVIEFLVKEGCSPKEIPNYLKKYHWDSVMDSSNIWLRHIKKYRNGEMKIEDKLRSVRSTTSVKESTTSVIENVLMN